MSSNPLEDDPGREHRIRVRAYQLWSDEGRPHGRHDEFWERARELVAMEDSAGAGLLPNPQSAGADPSREQPVEEAFIQQNLGEFPELTDQGEADSAPKPKRSARAAQPPEPKPAVTAGKAAAKAPERLPAKPSLKEKALKQQAGKQQAGKQQVGKQQAGAADHKTAEQPPKARKSKR